MLAHLFKIAYVCVCFDDSFNFVITLVSVLKGVTKFVLKICFERCLCEKFLLSKYLRFYRLEKILFVLVSFRQHYPTIKE